MHLVLLVKNSAGTTPTFGGMPLILEVLRYFEFPPSKSGNLMSSCSMGKSYEVVKSTTFEKRICLVQVSIDRYMRSSRLFSLLMCLEYFALIETLRKYGKAMQSFIAQGKLFSWKSEIFIHGVTSISCTYSRLKCIYVDWPSHLGRTMPRRYMDRYRPFSDT